MKCTYTWLKEFINFDFSPAALADRLTMLGLEVDSYQEIQGNFHDAMIGEIIDKIDVQHYKVTIGQEVVTATSASANLSAKQRVVVYCHGENNNEYAIASYQALDISDDESLIYVDASTPVGSKLADLIPESDTIYDIDITPNRPDCLSIIGIAREISTYTGNSLRLPDAPLIESKISASEKIQIQIQASEGCPRYGARVIQNISVHPSPVWMHDRLAKVGLRAINNVVDVTNYVMVELGHPLHAFDWSFLFDHQIRVRLSEHGERFVTLDGKGYSLDDSTVLICDGKRPVAIGGIMGGLNSEVKNSTKDVLLECAFFNPLYIRRSSGKLGIITDSSVRFSRGVDPNGVAFVIDRAAQIIQQTTQGNVSQGIVDEYVRPIQPITVTLRAKRVHDVLGTSSPVNQIKQILSRLGNSITEQKGISEKSVTAQNPEQDSTVLQVTVPTFRPDLTREIDLIEEIARVTGYEVIPEKLDTSFHLSPHTNPKERFLRYVREYWVGNGFYEIISNSMIPLSDISLKFYSEETIQLMNPLSEDMAVLRPSLIPSLMRTVQFNLFRQQEMVRLFEIGTTFQKDNQNHTETLNLGGVLTGSALPLHWQQKTQPIDFYDIKGLLSGFFQRFRATNLAFKTITHWALELPCVSLSLNENEIGIFGKIKTEILAQYDIPAECFIFELNLNNFIPNIKWDRQYLPIPKFPSVRRDLALIVDLEIAGGRLEEEIKRWGGTFLKSLNIFDVYTGKQVPEGKKSVAVSLIFQAEERTLVESEINIIVERIISELKRTVKAELRS